MMVASVADLRAMRDVCMELQEESDYLSAEQAVSLLDEARQTLSALKMAIDMLEARALRTIEQPILVGDVAWAKKPAFKKRPDQTLIRRAVTAVAARPDDNGEVPTAHDAAERAVKMMSDLYVSPSTLPKVGGVKAIGLEMDDVCTEEHTGFELKRTELS